ncbi:MULTISPECIES: GNAT family N-acetyltransferase [Haloferax]|uniref:GNAT family N-acetyltransferase n=2 Tax=Haloferax TaxID=2251 RepID=A0A6G1Z2Q8_9EURY|nr:MULTISPECIES: GNAT family N-acetyltransferase [Haloferax]KAB1188145.1 GNAT family N-acetyltransferase [Haloferax sp. CBA1149]MRW80820.1 GNAT family N-acetyltransferase [Haloferax marinisediminis]
MRLVAADVSDLDVLSDLWVELAHGQRAFGSHLFADANRAHIRASLAHHITFDGVLVVRDGYDGERNDSDIVGFVTFEVEAGTYEEDVTRGIISNLFVVPDRRDEGVGGRLLSAAEERLREAGADVVGLEVMADNESARKFYRRHGYGPHRIQLEKSIQNDTHSKEDQ